MEILTKFNQTDLSSFMEIIRKNNPNESEFHQAVQEWASSILPFVKKNRRYRNGGMYRDIAQEQPEEAAVSAD